MGDGQTPETTHGVHERAHDPNGGIPQASVRAALNQVLQSQGFRSSRRSQDFLRYVVERTLDGQAETLKERYHRNRRVWTVLVRVRSQR